MAAKRLQYLIDAIWKGSGATQQASVAIGSVGASAREADIAMAATQARSDMLGRKMSELGREVAKGNLSVEEATGKYNEFKNSLRDVGTGAQQGGRSLGQLVTTYGKLTAALGAVTIAAKKGFEAFEEGAVLDLARGRFDNLTASINSTSDVMLSRMREATAGMMSDAALIASASQIISLGLMDTEDGVIRLAKVVGELGWDMNQLIQTFSNNSKMRLDALGLSIADVDARTQALVATGIDLDRAFDLAVLEAGEARLALIGSAAGTTQGKIMQLKAAWENAKNAFKEQLAIHIADNVDLDAMVEDMGKLAGGAVQATEALADLMRILDAAAWIMPSRWLAALDDELVKFWNWLKTTDIGGPLVTANERAAASAAELAAQVGKADEVLANYIYVAAEAAAVVGGPLVISHKEAKSAAEEYAESISAAADATYEMRREGIDSSEALRQQMVADYEAQQEAAKALAEEQRRLEEQARALAKTYAGDFRQALQMAEDETVDFNAALFDQLAQLGASPDMLMAAGLALTDYGEEALASALKVATMNQAVAELAPLIADGTMSILDAKNALLDLSAALDEDFRAEFDTDDLLDAQEQARKLRELLDAASGRYSAHFAISSDGLPVPVGGGPSPVPGGGGQTPRANGTQGWERVPGAIGQPYPVTLHGGELFNVRSVGQGAYTVDGPATSTTATINFYGTSVPDVIRELQNRGLLMRDSFR